MAIFHSYVSHYRRVLQQMFYISVAFCILPAFSGTCQKPQCPKDCVVTDWSAWSPCKPYCLGTQTRPVLERHAAFCWCL